MNSSDISCAPTVKHTSDEIWSCAVFQNWFNRAKAANIRIESVYVAEAFQWGDVPEPRMLMLRVEAYDGDRKLDPNAYLRGDTVCVVATLLCNGARYGVLGSQVRLAGASSDVIDWPSGMVESTDVSPRLAALRELVEETNTKELVNWELKANVSEALTGSSEPLGVSEGGTDEGATIFWVEATVDKSVLNALKDATAGVATENEKIAVLIEPWTAIPSILNRGGRACLKALTGWLLVTHYLATPSNQKGSDL